ncbi:TRAP-type C4-dicarboxylate transport system permease small subunit [Sinobaca qinghaiensis]|uniref:TRAP-type C4-dicarboxylate transport system permease small subunit n=1 Tax=Sinobaca qinghaiensis TaxID=342944 RepID=A0A419V883_9BACL|nr:TRAP transporter small permease [Sinobaca qinghaiensis]RKD76326.1 TRAP-type C4-dicarboxylate transport system permease small subunit [Sinobaca qinghaiensis]
MPHLASSLIKIEEVLTKLLLAGIVILVFYSAMVRWAGVPVAWSVEMAQLLFIWLVFLGANQSLRNNRHIGIDYFVEKLPFKGKLVITIITNTVVAVFLMICIYYGFIYASEQTLRSIQNLPFSYSYITFSIPVGCTLMLITLLTKWIAFIRGSKEEFSLPDNTSKEKEREALS